jgi:hypothetical protein
MELINTIDNKPIQELMEDTLTESECNDLFSAIYTSLNLHPDGIISFKESEYCDCSGNALNEGFMTNVIKKMTEGLLRLSRNKYRLTVTKIYAMSKELNDIYTKVSDLLDNDVLARNAHKNDAVGAVIKTMVMVDRKTKKLYKVPLNGLIYDIESLYSLMAGTLEDIKEACDKKAGKEIRNVADSIADNVTTQFREKCWYVLDCDPIMRVQTYNRMQLESVLTYYKDMISYIYSAIYAYNYYVTKQVDGIAMIDKLYKKYVAMYKNDPDSKYYTDKIFETCLQNMTKCADFNSKAMVILEEQIRHYSEALAKIYNIIKS